MTVDSAAEPAAAAERQADKVTPEFEAEVDELVSHYPVSKRSASLPLLHYWQNHFGSIDDTGIDWIAARLELQPVNMSALIRTPSIMVMAVRRPRPLMENSVWNSSSAWPAVAVRR